MKFITAFRASHALLIVLGLFSLWAADFLSPLVVVLAGICYPLSEHERVRRAVDAIPVWLINLVTLLVFVYMVAVHFLAQNDLIVAVLLFTVFLQFLKLFSARTNRDYFQIYILSIAHLVLSTLLTSDLMFVVPFLLFIISAPWCLTIYNLKAQAERAYGGPEVSGRGADVAGRRLSELLQSRRAITGGFFWSTSVLSLLLLLNTAAIFLLFPRVSRGFLFRSTRYSHSVSGFSDKVDLRSFGLIKNNHQIVMRVVPKSREALNASGLFWRGLCYDYYDGVAWKRTQEQARRLPLTRTYGQIPIRRHNTKGLLEHEIHLERLDTDVFFALDRVEHVKWDHAYVERVFTRPRDASPAGPALAVDAYGSLHFDGGLQYERHYTAYSSNPWPAPKRLQEASRHDLPGTLDAKTYLQLPDLSQRFHDLAEQITQGRDNDYDSVLAVMKYLMQHCRYMLDIPRHRASPIEGFLFETSEGHCEYFATTAVLLCRAAGIPARLVSGFRGGDWNTYGEFMTVRQSDAHTWMEVYFEGFGWLPFDPTPPDSSATGYSGVPFEKWTHFVESLELTWHSYVVNYELRDQEKMASGLAGAAMSAFARFKGFANGASLRDVIDRLRERRYSAAWSGGSGPGVLPLAWGAAGVVMVGTMWGLLVRRRRALRKILSRVCARFLSLSQRRG
ncbi:MAG: transglutaminaseTgpA domain-containing protein, partial [Verrucomicrobia bacterium]|nr:transglutaminaseTgpA domain-containing protein [Verrucomicrobiota bacterium]